MSDEQQPRPLRRTRVTLNGPTLPIGRTVITNDDGSFTFERIPAGGYTLGAMREGYVAMQHGATRFGRPGTQVVVRDGESRRVTVRLPRGGVITGTVTSADGQPIPGVGVMAMREQFVPAAGERRLAPFAMMVMPVTDDRGIYRIHGLPAGDYLVSASMRPTPGMSGDLQFITDSDVRRAQAEVKSPSSSSGRGTSSTGPAPAGRRVAYAPVFFPSAPSASQATLVTVGKGEERTGIDIQLQPFTAARIEGVVHGARPGAANVLLSAPQQVPGVAPPDAFRGQRRIEPDGRFSIPGVPPGRYTVVATSWLPPEKQGVMPKVLSATTEISVDGEDISNVMLTLNPGITIAGRIAFEGTPPTLTDLSQFSVNLPIALTGVGVSLPIPFVQIDGSGGFRVEGMVPGVYRFSAPIRGIRAPLGPWWLKSIVVNGREVLDAPLDLRQSSDAAVVRFSERASTVAGVVKAAQGTVAADAWAIVFSTERAAWFVNSRRVAAVKPDADGRYSVRNLPPGDYYVAAAMDITQGEWFDHDVLQKLAPTAIRITLGVHEEKTQDVVVR